MDCMFSVDLVVEDPRRTATLLIDRLGLPEMRETWTNPGMTLDQLIYMRAYERLTPSSPTLIEIFNPTVYDIYPSAAMGRQTPGRPIQTHATVLITKQYDALLVRLRENGVVHFDMPDPGDGLRRCWFGVENLVPFVHHDYDPSSDGGLFLEVISWEGTTLATRGPMPVRVPEGGIVRVAARSYLVPDLDATLHSLRTALEWPAPDLRVNGNELMQWATLQPAMAASSALELVEPASAIGRHGAFFQQWGVGPHAIRLEVNGLAAKADDLRRRGTPFTADETPDGDPILLVDQGLDGAIVEFVDATG